MKYYKIITYGFLSLLAFISLACEKEPYSAVAHELTTYNNYDQLTSLGTTVYEQMKYHLAYLDPYEFLPEHQRTVFQENYTQAMEAVRGQQTSEVLNTYVTQEIISPAFGEAYQTLLAAYLDDAGTQDFTRSNQQLEQRMVAIKNNPLLALDEKKQLVTIAAIFRGANQYFMDAGFQLPRNDSDAARGGCSWLESWRCLKEYTGLGMLTGLGVGIGMGPGGGVAFGVGTAAGFTLGLIQIIRGDNGPCCESLDCNLVLGVSLNFADCTASATYRAYGFGADNTSLNWSNLGGTPATATTPTSNPRVLVRQDSPQTPVSTDIVAICSDGTTQTNSLSFVRNLTDLVKEVNGVSLLGPDQIYPGETYTYTGYGISHNANYASQWFVSGGTIISSSNSSATVRWNDNLSTGTLQLQVNNNCPGGEQAVFTISVTGDGPIP